MSCRPSQASRTFQLGIRQLAEEYQQQHSGRVQRRRGTLVANNHEKSSKTSKELRVNKAALREVRRREARERAANKYVFACLASSVLLVVIILALYFAAPKV